MADSGTCEVLAEGMEFLLRLGFVGPTIAVLDEPAAFEWTDKLTYTSELAKRAVRIVTVRFPDGDWTVVPLIKAEDDRRLDLVTWMEHKGINSPLRFMSAKGEEPTTFLRAFCIDFEGICEGPLKPILLGEDWVDLPFDWGGHR